MPKINLDFRIKNLDGNDMPGDSGHAGKLLANVISQMNGGNSIKLHDWALKLWNNQDLEIDDSDIKLLLSLIDSNENLFIISKAQMIRHIESLKNG